MKLETTDYFIRWSPWRCDAPGSLSFLFVGLVPLFRPAKLPGQTLESRLGLLEPPPRLQRLGKADKGGQQGSQSHRDQDHHDHRALEGPHEEMNRDLLGILDRKDRDNGGQQ